MGTRSKAADDAILKKLQAMSEVMLTKDHFDNEIQAVNEKLDAHDKRFEDIENRLTKVESNNIDYANDVYTEMHEQEKRKNNIIIFKLPEQDMELTKIDIWRKDKEVVTDLLTDMKLLDENGDNINMRISRLGTIAENKMRPMRITFRNMEVRNQIFSAAKNLKGNTKWKNVSIAPDLTKIQQKLGKKKREELLSLASTKNSERNQRDIDNGYEYKVIGNYGQGTLRMVKSQTNASD